jgi:hypothetical protein
LDQAIHVLPLLKGPETTKHIQSIHPSIDQFINQLTNSSINSSINQSSKQASTQEHFHEKGILVY